MEITRLQLHTADIAAQREFYTQVLELPLVAQTDTTLTLQAGTTELVFTQAADGEKPTYHFAFNIPAPQFDAAKAWLEKRVALLGTESDPPDKVFHSQSWHAQSIYFYDVAGNVAEFIARHKLPDDAAAPFSGRSIRRVDEIGLPTAAVNATVGTLQAQLGLEPWNATLNDAFVPVGDEYGLLIMVKTGRIWLATGDLAASEHPVTVEIKHAHGQQQIALPDLPYHIHTVA